MRRKPAEVPVNGHNPPFKSALAYSVQNEDYETELEVIRRMDRAAPLRVLLVASSGENALSVLTQDRVGEVWAVDLNPAQIHLCELRAAAVSALSRDDQLVLGPIRTGSGLRGPKIDSRSLTAFPADSPRRPGYSGRPVGTQKLRLASSMSAEMMS
jgi:hypothetical protein